jgi:ArsR family transcriptional regulator
MLSNINSYRYHLDMTSLSVLDCVTPLAGTDLSDGEAVDLERLFRVLADRHRVKIVNILGRAAGQPVCVCELTDALGLAQPTVSYHLKRLADAGLVTRERRASFVYYALADGALERVAALVTP